MIPLCLSIKKVFDGWHFDIFESCFSYVKFNIILFYMCCYLSLLLICYLNVFSLVQLIAKKSLLYLLQGLFDKSIFQL